MRLLAVGLVALLVTAVSVQARDKPLSSKEVWDLFFRSVAARQKLDQAAGATGGQNVDLLGGKFKNLLGSLPWMKPEFQQQASRVVDDSLNDLLDTVRQLLETMAEPLKIEFVNLNYSDPTLSNEGYVQELSISKLSTFVVDDLSLNIFYVNVSLGVHFDSLDVHGYYKIDAHAADQLHIYGDGEANIRFYEPTADVKITFGYDDEVFRIDTIDVKLKMSKLKVKLENLMGGGEIGDLLANLVSDVGPALLDEYRQEVSTFISVALKDTANALLATIPIDTIIDLLAGGL